MSSPPPADVLDPHDTTPDEIESRAEIESHLRGGSLAGLTVQGVRLDAPPVPDLSGVDVADTLFIGCAFASAEVEADLVLRGAHVVPPFRALPYPTHPAYLYTPEELAAGFETAGFAGMYDTVVYDHFRAHGGALPDVREALAQRLHDHGIDNALADVTRDWLARHGPDSVVGVMGGHAVPRGTAAYRLAATIGWELARADRLVVTGGGPGIMEAANLGAYLATRTPGDLAAAIDALAAAPGFTDHDAYTAAALRVRARFAPAGAVPWPRRGGLSIPTWLYGHEPANLFAARIAKMFSNAAREEMLLRLSRGGIVFAPGMAGTVQEVFQAATMAFYATAGPSGPFVFLSTEHWSGLPVEKLLRPLLAASPHGDLSHLVVTTDSVDEAVSALVGRYTVA